MTQEQIDEQIAVIRRVSDELIKSKEATRKFLMDAGIIKKKAVRTTQTTLKGK